MSDFDKHVSCAYVLRVSKHAVIGTMLVGLAVIASAQTLSVSNIETVRTLLDSAFPDLSRSGTDVYLTINTPYPSDWTQAAMLGVRVTPEGFKRPSFDRPDTQMDQFLEGRFVLDGMHVETATFTGVRVNSRKNSELLKELQAHPE
jgi:hypothetical protein